MKSEKCSCCGKEKTPIAYTVNGQTIELRYIVKHGWDISRTQPICKDCYRHLMFIESMSHLCVVKTDDETERLMDALVKEGYTPIEAAVILGIDEE
jgi:hypothetical protein